MAHDGNSTTTRLLTLLNVSATRTSFKGKGKRTHDEVDTFQPAPKLNKRKTPVLLSDVSNAASVNPAEGKGVEQEVGVEAGKSEVEDDSQAIVEAYESHFGASPTLLTQSSREAVDARSWSTSRENLGKLGSASVSLPTNAEASSASDKSQKLPILDRLRAPFEARQAKQPKDVTQLQNDVLSSLSNHRDLYYPSTSLDTQKSTREAIALHVLDHVTKKRRRVVKNNERLTAASKATPALPPPEDVQDQGFTRPSVLLLLPFRSSALAWVAALTSHTPTPQFQLENHERFLGEYGLPEGAVDKLAEAEEGVWPRDHVETFRGNCDDGFRVGVKMTRKSVKLFSEFYGSDIVIASPLGLRMAIEKEKNADFLSSIEVLVVDQMDALTMQNWEHTQFVFSHLNKLPKESRADTDFSRIKPWYLDGHSAYLRQSILLSAFETPDTRALFNGSLTNVAGKLRIEKRWNAVPVPEGIDQNFVRVECSSPKNEADKRFSHFTTQVMPAILKSAVQSTNTAVFVPSSFDFIRVQNWFRQHAGVGFAVLSEYSSNQDISRARQAFFQGKKAFILISERFHFYKRYKIRGIRNIIFYGPPDHPQFYTELLSYPFLDEGVQAEDVTCRMMYSKYDWFRLERIAGTEGATELVRS
ncbi:digestive organ expansion factor [Athelia psychrophila]|uniref:U3 small nucleolar RNA-associated protein 25 n=1 Tax=Athelia psychrophila TaxID=1759441 RepID=A0A166IH64_9AGAM|nr:digestive organ expansion factor [Fibularhizoctonia sp. CBS 109695]